MLNNTPNLQDLASYSVNRAGQAEVYRQTLYDFQVYPTAGQTSFTFFSVPQGQGVTSAEGATVGSAKTQLDTNMTLAGQLPQPQAFLIQSIEVVFLAGNSATTNTFISQVPAVFAVDDAVTIAAQVNDVAKVVNNAMVYLFIGSKFYLQDGPAVRFPPKAYLGVDAAVADISATTPGSMAVTTARGMGRPYYIDPELSLMASQNFNVTLNFGGAIATPSGFNGRVGIILDGYYFRNSQ